MESRTMAWALALVAHMTTATVASAQERREYRELHMGVEVRIVLFADSEDKARTAARAAFDRIAQLENVMSDYRPESELRRLERRPREWVPVTEPLFDVLCQAVEIAAATDGAFDPTVGAVVQLWRDARRARHLPDPAALDSARRLVSWRAITLDTLRRGARLARDGMRLDLGGIAKGYIVQHAVAALRERGVNRSMVVAGGDIGLGDAPPGQDGWKILSLADSVVRHYHNVVVSTSGPEAQFVEIAGVRYSHVVDPRTGVGLTNHFSAMVVSENGALADALSTALTVLGPTKSKSVLERYPRVQAHFNHNR